MTLWWLPSLSACRYMGLTNHVKKPLAEVPVDKVFIGSCTNGRIEDIRAVASVAKGRKVHPNIKEALVVPGSGLVKEQAEEEVSDVLRSAADCLRLRLGAANVHTDCCARILAVNTHTDCCARRASTRSLSRLASSGASRAALCALP